MEKEPLEILAAGQDDDDLKKKSKKRRGGIILKNTNIKIEKENFFLIFIFWRER